jgi:hypothetical protein
MTRNVHGSDLDGNSAINLAACEFRLRIRSLGAQVPSPFPTT